MDTPSPAEQNAPASQDWLRPPAEQQPLKRFIETIRERIWIVVASVAITTAFAIVYVATAEEVYEAEVEIVVSPVDDPDGTLAALGLITESNDPLRAIETASTLIETNAAAELAAQDLGQDRPPTSVLNDISIVPVAESNVLSITAEGSTPEEAAALANAFAAGAIEVRSDLIRRQIDEELPILERRLRNLPEGVTRDNLQAEADRLETLRAAGSDPTLEIVEPALPPGSPSFPRPAPSVLAGIIAGLVLGIGGAFVLQAVDPRLRREDQLRVRYRLPVLARVPKEEASKDQPLRWDRLSVGSIEAYRTLRAVLSRSAGRGSTSILVTSPGPGEGKTTSAMSLATSFALAGKSVILIEGDLRRPAIGSSFGIGVDKGVNGVLTGDATLAESLVAAPVEAGSLWLLLAERAGGEGAELLALPTAQDLILEAKELAEFVIVDSPPLATVVDALPLARSADEIVLTVRLDESRLDRIQNLAELLSDAGVKPTGFAVIGVPRQTQSYYMSPGRPVGGTSELKAGQTAGERS